MRKISVSRLLDKLLKLEQKTDEDIQNFFERLVKSDKCWKCNKEKLAWMVLNILSEGKRIKAVFYREYRVPDGLALFVSDVFGKSYPSRVAYLKYRTWTNATWIDLIIRPKKGWVENDYVYFVRIGIHEDSTFVDEDQVKELLNFLGEEL